LIIIDLHVKFALYSKQSGFDNGEVKWGHLQHRFLTVGGGYIRRVGSYVCDDNGCDILYTYGDDNQDYIFEDSFAHSQTVCLSLSFIWAPHMTLFGMFLIVQLVIDAAFGWLYYDSITEGYGESISSFLYTWTRNWNHTHPFCGFVFPKEKVITEWMWGWMSANDISKNLLQQCPGCKPGECKAVGIDACYVAVARSTLSGKQLFSVCVLLLLLCDHSMHVIYVYLMMSYADTPGAEQAK
jgi:hypothetical protein